MRTLDYFAETVTCELDQHDIAELWLGEEIDEAVLYVDDCYIETEDRLWIQDPISHQWLELPEE